MKSDSSPEINYASLKNIRGVDITPREIDTIACLLSGKGIKSIALLLSVSPRTIESHVRSIMVKIGCNSREGIIEFAEDSDQFNLFKEHYKRLLLGLSLGKESSLPERILPSRNISFSKKIIEILRRSRKNKIFSGIIVSILATFAWNLWQSEVIPFLKTVLGSQTNSSSFIRSEFRLPQKELLLMRDQLLDKINTKFQEQRNTQKKEICTVALIGDGGAGKTTLAHQYAKIQLVPIVWEVNAETKNSLIASFEQFLLASSQSLDEKNDYHDFLKITSLKEREQRLLALVKQRFKKKEWFLLFDNVEDIRLISDYLPSDPGAWGHGNILITTRNTSLKNSTYLSSANSINIGILSDEEKISLFSKILEKAKFSKEATQRFLKEIPSFPLDISTAAYYIKNTEISYSDYITRSNALSSDFNQSQLSLLNEIGEYNKTRYGILSLAIKNLVNIHPDYIDFLLFISVIDSQDIPEDLLKIFKDRNSVEKFVKELNKQSLILDKETHISQSVENKNYSTISLHRSNQAILFTILKNSIPPTQLRQKLEKVVYGQVLK